MKKLLSIALVVAMVMSLFCVVPASAAVPAVTVGEKLAKVTTIELEDYAEDIQDPTNIGFPEATAPASADKTECSGEAYLTYSSHNVTGYDVEHDDFSRYMSLDIALDVTKSGTYTFEVLVNRAAYGNPHLYVGGEKLARTTAKETQDIWAGTASKPGSRYYNWTGTLYEGANTVQLRFHASGSVESAYWAVNADYLSVTLTEELSVPTVGATEEVSYEAEDYLYSFKNERTGDTATPAIVDGSAKGFSGDEYVQIDSTGSSTSQPDKYMSLSIPVKTEAAGVYQITYVGTRLNQTPFFVINDNESRSANCGNITRANRSDLGTYIAEWDFKTTLKAGVNIIHINFIERQSGSTYDVYTQADCIRVKKTVDVATVGDETTLEMESYVNAISSDGIVLTKTSGVYNNKTVSGNEYSGSSALSIVTTKRALTAGMYANISVPVNVTTAGYYDLELTTVNAGTNAEESLFDICVNDYDTPVVKYAKSEGINKGLIVYKLSAYLNAGYNEINVKCRARASGSQYVCDAFVDSLKFTKIGDSNYATPASNTAKVSFTKIYTGKVIVALYSANNKFVGWGSADVENNHTASVELSNTSGAVSAKAFIWSDLESGIKPLAAHINLTVN